MKWIPVKKEDLDADSITQVIDYRELIRGKSSREMEKLESNGKVWPDERKYIEGESNRKERNPIKTLLGCISWGPIGPVIF